jgi:hypothetical protein
VIFDKLQDSMKLSLSKQRKVMKKYCDDIYVIYSGDETDYYKTENCYNVENKGRDIYKYYYGLMNYLEEEDHVTILINDSFVFLRDCPDVFHTCRYTDIDVMYMINSNQIKPHCQSYFISLSNDKARRSFMKLLEERKTKMVSYDPNELIRNFELEWPYTFFHDDVTVDSLFHVDVGYTGNINFDQNFANFVKATGYPIAKVKALYHNISRADYDFVKRTHKDVRDFLYNLKYLPRTFNSNDYLNANTDLKSLCQGFDQRRKDKFLKKHFIKSGKYERRQYNRDSIKVIDPSFKPLFQLKLPE